MSLPQAGAPLRYAVIGNPISHSRSPQIHAMFAEQTRIVIDYARLAAPLDGFRETVKDFFLQGGRGLNVTVPFKQQAYALAQENLSTRARLAGAVNTLTWRDGVVQGCNTDGVGLVDDLKRLGAALQGARLLLVGAGGAARGVLHPLAEAGCAEIRIVNRSPARATELAAAWQAAGLNPATRVSAGGLPEAARPGGWDVVINATASSLLDEAPALAYDMVYGTRPTAFMHQATADGAARTADGLGMLVGQAAESFFIWHGLRPDPSAVLTALRAELLAEG